jgi:hypothetical protein
MTRSVSSARIALRTSTSPGAVSRRSPGNPDIIRLYGTGTVHELGSPGFDELAPHFEVLPGARAIIDAAITRVSTSCGYAVPLMDYVSDRERLLDWERAKGEPALVEYRANKNAVSIDGLPGL